MLGRVLLFMFLTKYCSFTVAASVTTNLVCSPERELVLLASCQETCEYNKPLICFPRPRCICSDGKMWDEEVSKCVQSSECTFKGNKKSWEESVGGNFNLGSIFNSGGGNRVIRGRFQNNHSENYGAGLNRNISTKGSSIGVLWSNASSASGENGNSSGAASISGQGLINFRGILDEIFSLPINIPENIIKIIINFIKAMISTDWEALEVSSETIRKFIGHITSIIESFLEPVVNSENAGTNFTLGSLLNFGGGNTNRFENGGAGSSRNGTFAAPSFLNSNASLEGNGNSNAAGRVLSNIKGILEEIFTLPIRIPQNIVKTIVNFIREILIHIGAFEGNGNSTASGEASTFRQGLSHIRGIVEEIFSLPIRIPQNIVKTILNFIREILIHIGSFGGNGNSTASGEALTFRQRLSHIRGIVEEIFSIPIKIPETVAKAIVNFIRAIISMFREALRFSSETIRNIVGSLGGNGNFSTGGASISRQVRSDITEILEGVFTLPIRIPANIVETIVNFIRKIISMDWEALRSFFKRIRDFIGYIGRIIASFLEVGVNAVQRAVSVNSDLGDEFINRIRGVIGWVIKHFATFGIDIVKVLFTVIEYFQSHGRDIIDGISKVIEWFVSWIRQILNGSFNLEEILNLPIFRNFVSFFRSSLDFVWSFIDEHQDFFVPLFDAISNDITAVSQAIDTIIQGNIEIAAALPFGNGFNNSSGVINITSRSGQTTNQWSTGSSGFTEGSYPLEESNSQSAELVSSWLPSINETVTSTGIIETDGSQVLNISGGSSSSE